MYPTNLTSDTCSPLRPPASYTVDLTSPRRTWLHSLSPYPTRIHPDLCPASALKFSAFSPGDEGLALNLQSGAGRASNLPCRFSPGGTPEHLEEVPWLVCMDATTLLRVFKYCYIPRLVQRSLAATLVNSQHAEKQICHSMRLYGKKDE